MYGKMSLVKKTNSAELVGLRMVRPIMRRSMRTHYRIIPLSLPDASGFVRAVTILKVHKKTH